MKTKFPDPVKVNCDFLVQSELVFDAWLHPALIQKWLFVGPTSEIVKVDLDSKINGRFSILEFEKRCNNYIDHYGKYIEIDRPNKLVFSLFVPKHFSGETMVTIEIEDTITGSKLRLTQTGVSKDVTEESWKKMFGRLKVILENQ